MPAITNSKMTVQEWTILYESFKMSKNPDTDALRQGPRTEESFNRALAIIGHTT